MSQKPAYPNIHQTAISTLRRICLQKTPQPTGNPRSKQNKKRIVKQKAKVVVVHRRFTATTSKN
jgi:hypothetical protein